MKTRCLTLIETLIALVLLAVLGALVFPMLMESMEERQFESAADVTNEQLMLARAHAQATGTPVEVLYDAGRSQVQARVHGGGGADKFATIAEPWALREVARSVRLSARPFDPTQSSFIHDEPLASRLTEEEIWEALGPGNEVRLAIFMPDGSALPGNQFWLGDRKGRRGVFTINGWSGLALFERLKNHEQGRAGSEPGNVRPAE